MIAFHRADVGPDFENQVAIFVADLNAHAAQMDQVRAGIPGYDPYPAPSAPEHVRAAIRETEDRRYASDFQVIETDHEAIKKQKDAEAVRLRKLELVAEIRRMEGEAIAAADPDQPLSPAKRNLAALRAQEKINSILAKPLEEQTDEDKQFFRDLTTRQDTVNRIRLRAAEMISDIEDLTAETIDDWKTGDFK